MTSNDDQIVEIVKYDPKYKVIFEQYKKRIKAAAPETDPELIGSAAVPMVGKKEIDILVAAEDVKLVHEKLTKAGFGKGWPAEDRVFFTNVVDGVEVEIQVAKPGGQRDINARIVLKRLQEDKTLRSEFERLKLSWNGLTRGEYRKRKAEFVQKILSK